MYLQVASPLFLAPSFVESLLITLASSWYVALDKSITGDMKLFGDVKIASVLKDLFCPLNPVISFDLEKTAYSVGVNASSALPILVSIVPADDPADPVP